LIALPSASDPVARFHQRITADLALADLERAVRRLERSFQPGPIRPSGGRTANGLVDKNVMR
jgi:hypothetical protein